MIHAHVRNSHLSIWATHYFQTVCSGGCHIDTRMATMWQNNSLVSLITSPPDRKYDLNALLCRIVQKWTSRSCLHFVECHMTKCTGAWSELLLKHLLNGSVQHSCTFTIANQLRANTWSDQSNRFLRHSLKLELFSLSIAIHTHTQLNTVTLSVCKISQVWCKAFSSTIGLFSQCLE